MNTPHLSEDELRARLTEEQYRVMRQQGTEAPFSGTFVNHHADGMYRCAVCNAPLFSSETKFDSGSGWPSFVAAAGDAVVLREDHSHGMVRTEVVCARCQSHLGHVFDDGPKEKGGKRFCINSCALDFESHDTQEKN
jgi:peptide-methionine (R)-S-oxide reductase